MHFTAIYHSDPESPNVKLAYVGIDESDDTAITLATLFAIGNDITALPENCVNSYRGRSMRVGDVAQVDDNYYICEVTGWKPVGREYIKFS